MTVTSIFVYVLMLGVMIFIHELGHHLVAKWCGVRVEVFSIGFGKRLWGFVWNGTDYRVSALPFGGYVRMAGENPFEAHSGDPGEFMSHPRWQRIAIALAGPVANVLLAVAVVTGVYMVHFEYIPVMEKPAVVGFIDPDGPAAKAGMKVGDRIIKVENHVDPKWNEVFDSEIESSLAPANPLHYKVQRGKDVIELNITGELHKEGYVYFGIRPAENTVIREIETEMPAYKAGIRLGDEIVALNDQPIHAAPDLIDYLQKNKDKAIKVGVVRDGHPLDFAVAPVLDSSRNLYRIGVAPNYRRDVKQLGFVDAFRQSAATNTLSSLLVVKTIQGLVKRDISVKQMSGIVGMARMTGQVMKEPDWAFNIFLFMAAISVNLGILNLLPFPILDGGLIAITLIEGLLRRDIDQVIKERMYQTAFVFLIIFTVVVLYNDMMK